MTATCKRKRHRINLNLFTDQLNTMTDKELTSVLALTEPRSAKFKSARTRPLRVSKKSFPRTQRTWNMVSNFQPKFSTKTILFLSKWEFYEPCFAETFFAIFLRGYRHRCKRSNLQLLRPENLPLWLTEQFSFPIDNKSISFDQSTWIIDFQTPLASLLSCI